MYLPARNQADEPACHVGRTQTQSLDLPWVLWRKKTMMNRFEGPGAREARIRYLDGDFQVTSPGAFVRCAVTGESIPLDELKYWSVARQEAYISAAASLTREMEVNPELARRRA
jgi:hypothetical protein